MQRRIVFFLLLALVALAAAVPAAAQVQPFPDVIPLPDGFAPEGIAVGRGTTFYVGSLADGAIYAGDLRSGQGAVLAAGTPGRAIAGLYVDQRTNYLFAAGTQSGGAFVFDATTGAQLAYYQLATAFPSFVNDVIVTREAAYFTDSFRPVFYRLPLGPGGELPDPSQVREIPLSGDFVFVPGPFVFNSNGIEATPNGRWLLIVNSVQGKLYRVDPLTGEAKQVDVGGVSLEAGDGLRLQGKILYVVQNRLNQIAVIKLAPDYASGKVMRTITDPNFEVPTTVALFGSRLYAVNARFGLPPGDYEVVKGSRK